MNGDNVMQSSDWRAYLSQLPQADPPETLWTSLQARRALGTRRRRPAWLPVAMAAAVTLGAVLVVTHTATQVSLPQALPMAAAAADPDPAIRALDDALALAYSRNADQAELDALWATRERLLSSAGEGSEPLLARL